MLHHVPLQCRIISIFARTEYKKIYIFYNTPRQSQRTYNRHMHTAQEEKSERPSKRVSESNNKNNGSKLLCNSSSKTDIDFRKMNIHNRSPHMYAYTNFENYATIFAINILRRSRREKTFSHDKDRVVVHKDCQIYCCCHAGTRDFLQQQNFHRIIV